MWLDSAGWLGVERVKCLSVWIVVTVAALLINRSMALFNIVYSQLDVLFQF